MKKSHILVAAFIAVTFSGAAHAQTPIQLKQGERIVFLGAPSPQAAFFRTATSMSFANTSTTNRQS